MVQEKKKKKRKCSRCLETKKEGDQDLTGASGSDSWGGAKDILLSAERLVGLF